jgi:AAA+ superfamily predicted ATPase
VSAAGGFRYIEVEPHGLASAALGRSQKAVTELFTQTIAENATQPLIVLLDEVETLAADRSKMSLEANPVDVHRATDAVLAQLDHLASTCPNLLVVATSNFPEAIDSALVSRADLVRTVGLPAADARRKIIESTLEALGEAYKPIMALKNAADMTKVVKVTEGLDGRQVRKLVVAACARRKEVALHPENLTMADILAAATAARMEHKEQKEKK